MKEQLHIYTRVSSAIQEDGTSLEKQKQDGIELAERNGWQPIIHDEGSHTSKNEDPFERPVLGRLLLDMRDGKIRRLFVWNLDRLTRNEDASVIIKKDLRDQNIELYTSSGRFNFDNSQDRLMFALLSAVAEYENGLRATRTREGKLMRLRDGKIWKGGPPPFGYSISDKKLVINEEESKSVEFIFKSYIDGKSAEEIRWDLTQQKVPTRRGNSVWSAASVQSILKGNCYRGFFTYTDRHPRTKRVIEELKIPCITALPFDLVEEVDAALELRAKKRIPRPNARTYLLRDFLVCEQCNEFLKGRIYEKRNFQQYSCPTNEKNSKRRKMATEKPKCSLGSLNIRETDNFVWHQFLDVLEQSNLYKHEIKKLVLGIERTHQDQQTEMEATKKRLGRNQSKLNKELTLCRLLEEANDPDHEIAIQKQKLKIAELEQSLIDDRIFISHNEQQKVWVDWVSRFGKTIGDYRKIIESEDRLPILKRFLEKIEVKKIDAQTKSLRFHFKFGYVNDGYLKDEQKVKVGERQLALKVENKNLKGRRGRPKKQ